MLRVREHCTLHERMRSCVGRRRFGNMRGHNPMAQDPRAKVFFVKQLHAKESATGIADYSLQQ